MKSVLQILLLSGISIVGYAQDDISSIEKNLTNRIEVEGTVPKAYTIEERIESYKIPGVSIAIARDGKLVYAKGFGISNSKENTLVDEHTLFQAASISKPLSALAALKLVEEGKIDLDQDVNTYLSSWKVPENKFTEKEKVTIRRILNHTAGLTVHGFPGYAPKDDFPSTADVLNGKGNTPKVVVDTIPGSIWRYSGGGYTVMQQVVEDVTKMKFSDYLDKYILSELGMKESTFEQPITGEKAKQASGAYDTKGKLIKAVWHNYPEVAAAGLWTTPSDLIEYCFHIRNIYNEEVRGVLPQSMVKEMLTPGMNGWGLGPRVQKNEEVFQFGHDGKNAGFTNMMRAFVNKGDAIVVMTNGDNGMKIIEEIVRAASKVYGWKMGGETLKVKPIELEAVVLKKFVGEYPYQFGEDKGLIKAKVKKGILELKDSGMDDALNLTPLSDTEFIDLEQGIMIDFKVNDKGTVESLLWNKRWEIKKEE